MRNKNLYSIFLLFILSYFSGNSQNFSRQIDSLKKLIEASKEDSVRMNRMIELVGYLDDMVEIVKYNDEAGSIASKLMSSKDLKLRKEGTAGRCKYLWYKSQILTGDGKLKEAIRVHEEILALLKNSDLHYLISRSCNELIIIYDKIGQPEKGVQYLRLAEEHLNFPEFRLELASLYQSASEVFADSRHDSLSMEYSRKALKIRLALKDSVAIANSYNNFGYFYHNHGLIDKAAPYYEKAIEILPREKDPALFTSINTNLGVLYYDQGNIRKALTKYFDALELSEKTGNLTGCLFLYNNIAHLYNKMGEPEKALLFYNKSVRGWNKSGDKKGMGKSYNNVSAVYLNMKNFKLCKVYLDSAYNVYNSIHDDLGLGLVYNNYGGFYIEQNMYKEALTEYMKSEHHHKIAGNYLGQVQASYNIGNANWKLNNKEEAGRNYLEAFKLAEEIHNIELSGKCSNGLYEYYKFKGDKGKALYFLKKSQEISDSLLSVENKKAALKKQFQYEYDKKLASDSLRAAEHKKLHEINMETQRTRLSKERQMLAGISVGAVLLLFLLWFVWSRYRLAGKQKKIIQGQKFEMEKAYEKLHEKNKEVLDSIYYARRIQRALVTNENYIERSLRKLQSGK